ncbi:MAG: hypothetical protein K6V97_04070 [Actinomycetia bacterium]|nr:hypothetical protein [Actinomycetes bacterium]
MVHVTMTPEEILRVLQRRHANDLWFLEVKDGATLTRAHRRLDALAIRPSWSKPRFVGYEVKVSRHDFLRDDKWDGYVPLVHQFSFACPWGVIGREEIPEGIGLYWVKPDGTIRQVRRPVLRPMDRLPAELLYYLVLSRLQPDRHPWWSDRREYLAAWVEDKAARHELGRRVGSKLAQQVAHLQAELDQERRARYAVESDWKAVKRVLDRHGLPTGEWAHRLDEALTRLEQAAAQGIDHTTLYQLRLAADALDRVLARWATPAPR